MKLLLWVVLVIEACTVGLFARQLGLLKSWNASSGTEYAHSPDAAFLHLSVLQSTYVSGGCLLGLWLGAFGIVVATLSASGAQRSVPRYLLLAITLIPPIGFGVARIYIGS